VVADDAADDPDSQFYRDGLAAGRLLLQRCAACDRPRFPALVACPYCGARDASVVEAAGTGRVYSWVTARVAVTADAADVPYAVAVVQLDEGCRVLGRLREIDDVACEMAVRVVVASGRAGASHLEFVRAGAP
jgi:uncharacterized OB-fold protein